jgi:hypothetical protein
MKLTAEQLQKLKEIRVGDFLTFPEEKLKYAVRAVGKRYVICTKPFFRTVLYSVLDLEEGVRGTENLVFGAGAETDKDCAEMIDRLEGAGVDNGQWHTEVSHRNRIPLQIKTVWLMPREEEFS